VPHSKELKVGIVGAVGRGGSFRAALETHGARVQAVCDIREDRLEDCMRRFGAEEKYVDYAEMLEKSDLDAVVVGTPMNLHVPQSIMALERDLHVLCEVPAGVSVDECRRLVEAQSKSKGVYMMAENYTYMKPNVVMKELTSQGLFGDVYYAEGEYLHELKQMNEDTPWRRKWQTGIEGVTYGTHSLGPILQWMAGDRVAKVCCEGSGHHYKDPRGDDYHQDSSVMLCKTVKGALIKIRVDMLSDRPGSMANYQLQGTDGAYESSRGGPGERNKIWLRQLSRDVCWLDLDSLMEMDSFAEKYVPDGWRNPTAEALRAGHGGGDYFEVLDFINAATGKLPCPIGIHEAMDMTLPGLISQQAVARGAWLDVPDSRAWPDAAPQQQLQMLWPEEKLSSPPVPKVPDGYVLRCYEDRDADGWLAVMAKAGFDGWDYERLAGIIRKIIPGGFFVIVHQATGKVVATAHVAHNPAQLHPAGGEVGWVAGDPDHKGKGLGLAVCAAVTARSIAAGYKNIYLRTDDHRLPAIKTYLKLGYEPLLFCEGMAERWQAVREKLNW